VIVFSLLIGGVLGYRLGKRIFSDPQVDELHRLLRQYVKEQKKLSKDRASEDRERTSTQGPNLMDRLAPALRK
jgi:hypothetical protein